MKTLHEILHHLSISYDGPDTAIEQVVFDSRMAKENCLFVALSGGTFDGHDFLTSVFNQGCAYAIVQKEMQAPEGMTLFKVADSREALGHIACAWFDHPSKNLRLIGVTGTNGKTTTATLLYQLFTDLGISCGLISTVVNKVNRKEINSTHTTPDPFAINKLLQDMLDEGCTHCFMEVSSHAIHQKRIAGLNFTGGVFTNITHDHLDYHKTFSEYIAAKKGFFDGLSETSFALVNSDDKNAGVMCQNSRARKYTFALNSVADFKGVIMENSLEGIALKINNIELLSKLIGKFNAYNLLAVFGVGTLLGIDQLQLLTGISNLDSVNGRFQFFKSNKGVTVVVDYAHTPDALQNVLNTIQHLIAGGKIITVVGCGGDRDRDKRPEMAKIAQRASHQVILTSDNPRSEDPQKIIEEMMEGIDPKIPVPIISIQDRKHAIQTASLLAQQSDIVLIAGKGHEAYQEILGVRYDFNDFEIAFELFNQNY